MKLRLSGQKRVCHIALSVTSRCRQGGPRVTRPSGRNAALHKPLSRPLVADTRHPVSASLPLYRLGQRERM